MTSPGFTRYSPRTMCRSVPQIVVRVTRITASPNAGARFFNFFHADFVLAVKDVCIHLRGARPFSRSRITIRGWKTTGGLHRFASFASMYGLQALPTLNTISQRRIKFELRVLDPSPTLAAVAIRTGH